MTALPTSAPPAAEPLLPALRQELQIIGDDGANGRGGVVFDPLRQRYFRLDQASAELLQLWPQCKTAEALIAASRQVFGLSATKADIASLENFLVSNQLTLPQSEKDWRRLVEQERRGERGWASWLVHNYLFVQIPLIDPKHLLRWLSPIAAPLFTRAAALTIAGAGVAGLYLVSRQWDQFIGTFPHLFSMQGLILYAFALVVVKTVHELAHALTAHRFGCRVPAMGICFMVLMPMLYCDVTDAWRLSSRRRKIAIDAAGLIAETGLASIATLAWAFLPDGTTRSVAFAVATTSWLLSLGLNLNPFMRFDGYYILSDAVRVENLQPRAFAIGTWLMREILFGLGRPPPEPCSRRMRGLMAAYAYAVWIYRLILFTGIALLVYHLTFKLLGILLFAIEIIYFVARPIVRELGAWTGMRDLIIVSRRAWVTGSIAALLVIAAFAPWSTRIAIPAVVEHEEIQRVFSKRAALVREVPVALGNALQVGDIVARLDIPELEHEIRRTQLSLQAVLLRLDRRTSDATDKAETIVLEDSLAGLRSKLAGLAVERDELVLRAEKGGRVMEIDRTMVAGRWVQRSDPIAVIVGGGAPVVRGYLNESDLARLDPTATARFIPEGPLARGVDVKIETVAPVGSDDVDIPELSSHYGGGIAARTLQRPGKGRVQVGLQGQVLVTARVAEDEPAPPARVIRGTLHAAGRAESFAARAWRQVLKVLIRESGV